MKKTLLGSLFLIIGVAVVAQTPYLDPRPANAPHQKPALAGQYRAPERKSNVAFDQTAVVSGLQSPWAIAFLPGGKMLVTEKTPGRLRVVNADGTLVATPVAGVPKVDAACERPPHRHSVCSTEPYRPPRPYRLDVVPAARRCCLFQR